MQQEEFEKIIEKQLKESYTLLLNKNSSYATDDKISQFRKAAAMQGITMRAALSGMMAKHTVSVHQMCQDELEHDQHIWDEKISDTINYLLILQAVLYEERSQAYLEHLNEIPDYDNLTN